jgi:hypothetical protein
VSAQPEPDHSDESPARPRRPSRRGGSGVRAHRAPPEDEAGPEEVGAPDHPGLELHDAPEFQRRTWMFQRIGWAVMAAILASALLGLMGRGPLSHTYVVQRDAPLALEYERFGRHGSASQLRVHLLPGSSEQGRARLRFDRRFYENVEDLQVVPEPTRFEAGAEWITLTVATDRPDLPTVVVVDYTPEGYGPLAGRVGLEGKSPVHFDQFVYP